MSFQRNIEHHRRLLSELQNRHHFFPLNVTRYENTVLFNNVKTISPVVTDSLAPGL